MAFQYLKESIRKLEKDFGQGPGVSRQEGMASLCLRVRQDIRKKLSAVREVRPWHRLLMEAVAAPSLEVSKARLDRAWSNLG